MKKLYILTFLLINIVLIPFEGQALSLFSAFTSFKSKALATISSIFLPCEKEIIDLSPAPITYESKIADLSSKPILTGLSSMFTPFKNQSTYSNLYWIGGGLSAAALLYLASPYIRKFLSKEEGSKGAVISEEVVGGNKVEEVREEENKFVKDCQTGEIYSAINESSLHIAVKDGNRHQVIDLIVSGCIEDINALDQQGNTPLRVALNQGYFEMAVILQAAGGRSSKF